MSPRRRGRQELVIVSMDPSRWWVLALLGAISIAAGVIAIAYPDITLRVFGIFVGIYLLTAGAAWVAVEVEEEMTPGRMSSA